MRDYNYTDLPIVAFNIHGVFTQQAGFRYSKLESPHFWEAVNNARIFALIETHHTASEIDQIQISGYKCYNVCRKKRQFGRNSGGIAVYVENNLLDGVKKVPSSGSENILIKRNKISLVSHETLCCVSVIVFRSIALTKKENN